MGLATALGWKFNHEPGITTLDGVLIDWPASLGTRPTAQALRDIEAEYDVFVAALPAPPSEVEVLRLKKAAQDDTLTAADRTAGLKLLLERL